MQKALVLFFLLLGNINGQGFPSPQIAVPNQGLAPFLANDSVQPYVFVLGTAQDGGLPQIGCQGPNCKAVAERPAMRRLVSSLLVVDPASGKRWLIDASPDIREQVDLASGHPPYRSFSHGRPALFDGVFLTHAHMGHYSGLLHFGREAYGHPEIPLYGTSRLLSFLQANGPWSLLFESKHFKPVSMTPDVPVILTKSLSITPFLVPHRDEFSDTVGFLIKGPNKKLLYIPDIDKWTNWDRDVRKEISEVNIALLDGTFFADGEIPGRAMVDIPHPFITESMSLFSSLKLTERQKIYFIHFNHTNPAVDLKSSAASQILKNGMHCVAEGQVFNL